MTLFKKKSFRVTFLFLPGNFQIGKIGKKSCKLLRRISLLRIFSISEFFSEIWWLTTSDTVLSSDPGINRSCYQQIALDTLVRAQRTLLQMPQLGQVRLSWVSVGFTLANCNQRLHLHPQEQQDSEKRTVPLIVNHQISELGDL